MPRVKTPPKEPETPEEETTVIDLTERVKDYEPDRQRILLAIGGSAMSADEIIEVTGLPAPLVLSELTMLELDGTVSQVAGRRYVFNL